MENEDTHRHTLIYTYSTHIDIETIMKGVMLSIYCQYDMAGGMRLRFLLFAHWANSTPCLASLGWLKEKKHQGLHRSRLKSHQMAVVQGVQHVPAGVWSTLAGSHEGGGPMTSGTLLNMCPSTSLDVSSNLTIKRSFSLCIPALRSSCLRLVLKM